eukprot:COSAG05_NODE_2927_length_2496_cov_1.884022_2_plen_115_part_00
MKNYSTDYAVLKSLDPYHPAFGAIQCPRSWEFLDGPGGRGGGSPGPVEGGAPLIFDVAMHENYDVSFAGHAGEGPRAPIEQVEGDLPLRNCEIVIFYLDSTFTYFCSSLTTKVI